MLYRYFSLITFIFCHSFLSYAQLPGDLDQAYGDKGIAKLPLGVANAFGQSMVIQPDGKAVIAAIANSGIGNDFALVRLTTNGHPDPDFGDQGIVFTDFDSLSDAAQAIALDGLQRIIVAGYVDNGNGFDFGVARYLHDGSLDESFGEGGIVTTSIGITAFCEAVAVQADHRIIAAGFSLSPVFATNEFTMVRYTEEGKPDSTFHEDGIVTTNMGIGAAVANDIFIQPDGKIILAGQVFNQATFFWEIGIARYLSNGSLDKSFDHDGIVFKASNEANYTIRTVTLDNDKRIVVGGFIGTAPSNNQFAIARFNLDGSPDGSFGNEGVVINSYGAENNQINTIAVQPDDRILVAGTTLVGNADRIAIARLNENGSFDTSFSSDGIIHEVIGQNDGIESMALQSDGKLLVVGESFNGNRFEVIAARYETGIKTHVKNVLAIVEFSLFPNPVNEVLNTRYELKNEVRLGIRLYDMSGRLLSTLSKLQDISAGPHEESFLLPSGLHGVYQLVVFDDQGTLAAQSFIKL